MFRLIIANTRPKNVLSVKKKHKTKAHFNGLFLEIELNFLGYVNSETAAFEGQIPLHKLLITPNSFRLSVFQLTALNRFS